MHKFLKILGAMIVTLGLFSCGGGGDDESQATIDSGDENSQETGGTEDTGDTEDNGQGNEDDGQGSEDTSDSDGSSDNENQGDPNLIVNCGLEFPCSWVSQDNKYRFCLSDGDSIVEWESFVGPGYIGPETIMVDSDNVRATDNEGRSYIADLSPSAGRIRLQNENGVSFLPDESYYESLALPFSSNTGTYYNVRFENIPNASTFFYGSESSPCNTAEFVSGVPAIDESFFIGGLNTSWSCLLTQYKFREGQAGEVGVGSTALGFNWEYESDTRTLTMVDDTGETIEFTDVLRIGSRVFETSIVMDGVSEEVSCRDN